MRARLLLGCVLVAGLGCGSGKFVPVSGKVTLNGQPVAGAAVLLEPLNEDGTEGPGIASAGKTNENGEFKVKATSGQEGALVGKYRVRISLQGQAEGDERRGGGVAEKLPRRYNVNSKETLDVPPGGRTDIVFALTSP